MDSQKHSQQTKSCLSRNQTERDNKEVLFKWVVPDACNTTTLNWRLCCYGDLWTIRLSWGTWQCKLDKNTTISFCCRLKLQRKLIIIIFNILLRLEIQRAYLFSPQLFHINEDKRDKRRKYYCVELSHPDHKMTTIPVELGSCWRNCIRKSP